MSYVYLALAIAGELLGTTLLKVSNGFSRLMVRHRHHRYQPYWHLNLERTPKPPHPPRHRPNLRRRFSRQHIWFGALA